MAARHAARPRRSGRHRTDDHGRPEEAARIADRVVTLDAGRLVADQAAGEFARTRLRPRVAVRSPYAGRLAAALTKEARTGRRSVEVVREGGNRLSVYGTTTSVIGETAFRHGILVHQLADEIGDMGPDSAADGALPERAPTVGGPAGGRRPPEREKTVFGFSVSDPPTMTRTESTTSAPSAQRAPRPNSSATPALSTASAPPALAPAPSAEPAEAPPRAEARGAVDAETTARHPGRPETGQTRPTPTRILPTRIVPSRIATTRITALRTLLPGARRPFARQSWTMDPETRTGGNDAGAHSFDTDSPSRPPSPSVPPPPRCAPCGTRSGGPRASAPGS